MPFFSDLDRGLNLGTSGLGLEPSGLGLGLEPSGLRLEDLVLVSTRPRPIKNIINICNL